MGAQLIWALFVVFWSLLRCTVMLQPRYVTSSARLLRPQACDVVVAARLLSSQARDELAPRCDVPDRLRFFTSQAALTDQTRVLTHVARQQ